VIYYTNKKVEFSNRYACAQKSLEDILTYTLSHSFSLILNSLGIQDESNKTKTQHNICWTPQYATKPTNNINKTCTHFNHFKIYSSEAIEPNWIKPFSWDNPLVALFQNCDQQPCPPYNIGTVTKIEICFIDHYCFKLKWIQN
jgi:hypothetical protein